MAEQDARKKYSDEDKAQVADLLKKGMKPADIEAKTGVKASTIILWKKQNRSSESSVDTTTSSAKQSPKSLKGSLENEVKTIEVRLKEIDDEINHKLPAEKGVLQTKLDAIKSLLQHY